MSDLANEALRQVVREIRLKDSFVLGLINFTVQQSVIEQENASGYEPNISLSAMSSESEEKPSKASKHFAPTTNAALMRRIEAILSKEVGDRFVVIDAEESIDEEVRSVWRSGTRTAKYALTNWKNTLVNERFVLLDLTNLDSDISNEVSLLTDGMIAIVDQIDSEIVGHIKQSQSRGVHWLGYWQLSSKSSADSSYELAKAA